MQVNCVMSNEQLGKELHKPSIRKFKRQRVYSSFKYNIWGVDLADMQLIRKYNTRVRYLLYVIDFFSIYAWAVPIKKKGVSIINASQSILGSSERKLNKIWVDQGREFCNSPFKNG